MKTKKILKRWSFEGKKKKGQCLKQRFLIYCSPTLVHNHRGEGGLTKNFAKNRSVWDWLQVRIFRDYQHKTYISLKDCIPHSNHF